MRAHSYSTHSPRRLSCMRAWKYGRRYVRRATSTARRLAASRLKNQMPGRSPASTQVREAERHDADPGVAVVRLDLELRRDVLANGVHGDAPVSEEQVLPCLRAPPAARRDRPGAVLRVLERASLPGDGVERAQVRGCRAAPARARSLRREP